MQIQNQTNLKDYNSVGCYVMPSPILGLQHSHIDLAPLSSFQEIDMRKRLRLKIDSVKLQENRILSLPFSQDAHGYCWIRSERRYHLIWNLYNPSDKILSNGGCSMHHKNEIKNDDRIENLQKMTISEHRKIHGSGENSNWYGRDVSDDKNPMYGKHHSIKTRELISAKTNNVGENNPMYGKHHSETTKKILKEKCGHLGEGNGSSKLTNKRVLKIRQLYAFGRHNKVVLGKMFSVSDVLIGKVVRRESWRHI